MKASERFFACRVRLELFILLVLVLGLVNIYSARFHLWALPLAATVAATAFAVVFVVVVVAVVVVLLLLCSCCLCG
jgi:hypothetical protein